MAAHRYRYGRADGSNCVSPERQGEYVAELERKMITDTSTEAGVKIEKDGVHFGYYAESKAVPSLILYKKGTEEIAEEIPFPQQKQAGAPWVMKVQIKPSQYEYNFRDGDRIVTDPYARKVVGREVFGAPYAESPHSVRGGFLTRSFDWGEDELPQIPFTDAVMYHLHVRGFTMQKNSGVRRKGTFAGLTEKIPYLKSLGVNQVRLMPVFEFRELMDLQADRKRPSSSQQEAARRALEKPAETQQPENRYKLNFWGYTTGCYFAPKAAYASGKYAEEELKSMVKAFHAQGMEVILEFAFPDEMTVEQVSRCLHYWAYEYHIDGFAVIGRDSLRDELLRLPLFGSRKLISTWIPEEEIQKNAQEREHLLASSNDGFMMDCRRMLKGEENALPGFVHRLRSNPDGCASINYITNHDGFTLLDLVSYDEKHNEANKEMGRDGSNYNCSWNCGAEGPTKKKEILALRMRQRKNAYAMMLFSQGVPMLMAGDEFGNSQDGNNNPYCHDSELSWTDWSRSRANRELTEFVRSASAFRRQHKSFHQDTAPKCLDYRSCGVPDLSFHSDRAWYGDMAPNRRHIGSMYAGSYAGEDGFFYIAWNFHWNEQQFALPILPKNSAWYKVMDTSLKESFPAAEQQECLEETKMFAVPPRTVIILEGRE